MSSENSCPVCVMGRLRATGMPYMQVINDTLIQAPTISGWKCDVCGETFFDGRALRQLELLIHEAGPPPNRYHAPPPVSEREPVESAPGNAEGLHPPSE